MFGWGKKMKENHPFTSAIIAAAGNSSRVTAVSDKLFAKINNKTVIEMTIQAFQNSGTVDEIIIVTREDSIVELNKLKEQNKFDKITHIITGGSSRAKSIENGIHHLSSDCLFISIHDGARPFITPEEIDNIHNHAYKYNSVCCGYNVVDTIKEVNSLGFIEKSLNRETLFAAATPQVFRKDIYLKSLKILNNQIERFTDDATMVFAAGFPVKTFFCSDENKKITTDNDLKL